MSARTQRYRVAGVAAALSVFVTAAPAAANDLEDFLQGAAAAEYSGRRIVITMWDGESKAGIFAVTHVSDMMVIGTGDGGSLVGGGRVADGVNDAVMVHEWSRYTANSRYTTTKPVQTVRLGRTAEMIEIIEDGVVRARFTYDALTKVPLATEIFDPSGRLFRYSVMLEFDPKPELSYADMEAMGEVYDVMHPVEVDSLPDDARRLRPRRHLRRARRDYPGVLYRWSLLILSVPGRCQLEARPIRRCCFDRTERCFLPTLDHSDRDLGHVEVGRCCVHPRRRPSAGSS